jgi:hypothetical protein
MTNPIPCLTDLGYRISKWKETAQFKEMFLGRSEFVATIMELKANPATAMMD